MDIDLISVTDPLTKDHMVWTMVSSAMLLVVIFGKIIMVVYVVNWALNSESPSRNNHALTLGLVLLVFGAIGMVSGVNGADSSMKELMDNSLDDLQVAVDEMSENDLIVVDCDGNNSVLCGGRDNDAQVSAIHDGERIILTPVVDVSWREFTVGANINNDFNGEGDNR